MHDSEKFMAGYRKFLDSQKDSSTPLSNETFVPEEIKPKEQELEVRRVVTHQVVNPGATVHNEPTSELTHNKKDTHMGSENMTVAPHVIGGDGLGMGGLGGGGILGLLVVALLFGGGRGLGGFGGNGGNSCESVAVNQAIGDIRGNLTGLAASVNQLERGQDTAATLAAIGAVTNELRTHGTLTNAGFVNLSNQVTAGFTAVAAQSNQNTQQILNVMCMDRENALRDRNQALVTENSNLKQTVHWEHHFEALNRSLSERFHCFDRHLSELRGTIASVASGNTAGGVGSGNGSNNVTYNLEQMIQAAIARSTPVQVRAA